MNLVEAIMKQLPTMQPVCSCRTRQTRTTKLFEQIRLYFSHFEVIQIAGETPIVGIPTTDRQDGWIRRREQAAPGARQGEVALG
jgi:hypothetical protein